MKSPEKRALLEEVGGAVVIGWNCNGPFWRGCSQRRILRSGEHYTRRIRRRDEQCYRWRTLIPREILLRNPSGGTLRVLQLFGGGRVRRVLTEGGRQIHLVFLLVDENVANMFGHGKFPQCFALADALAIVADGFIFLLKVVAEHIGSLLRRANFQRRDLRHSAEIINLLGDYQGVIELFEGVFLELRGYIHVFGPLEDLGINDVSDDGLIFASEVPVQQFDQFFTRHRGLGGVGL